MSRVRHIGAEQSARPAGASGWTVAPGGLRRRVLATVRSEPEPIGAGLLHSLRRLAAGRAMRAGTILGGVLLAGGIGIIALDSSPRSLGQARVAADFRGARAALRRVGGHAELVISGMPQPPIGEVYQVWLAQPGAQPQPTDALFTVTEAGQGSVEVPGSLQGVHEVMVTSEPVGGSSHPTSPAVLSVLLGGRLGG